MSPTPLFTIRLPSGVKLAICNVADAVNALGNLRWPGKGSAVYSEAVRTSNEALAGHCKVQVAVEAFRKAAKEAGVLDGPNIAEK